MIFVVVLMLAVAMPGMAGDKHEKCKGSTQDCLDKMATKLQNKAWLGVHYEPTEEGQWQITKVIEGSPAEAAGLKKGDVLVSMDGVAYTKDNSEAIKAAWSKVTPGSDVTCVVKRSGSKVKLHATLATMPPEMVAEYVGEHMMKDHAQIRVASN